jgi:hypothetical protein
MRNVSRPYGPAYGPVIAALLLLIAVSASAQTTVTDSSGSASNSTAGAAANNRNANTLSNVGNQSATGAIAGTQVNAPVTSRSGAAATSTSGSTSSAQSGSSRVRVGGQTSTSSQSVRVVNVTPGYSGGGGGGTNGTNGTNATDPAGANGTNGANSADPPALGSAGNPLTENIGGTQTIRNTPEIVAPNISGGNPCLVGISGGGAGPGIGITFGVGYSDRGCERRNSAALLSNIGERDVAIELMCDDQNVREAMARSGHPCAADRAVAAPVAAVDPAVIRRQQDAAQPAAQLAAASKPARPDWCGTSSPAELRAHRECDQ